jgi:hypothetical protein
VGTERERGGGCKRQQKSVVFLLFFVTVSIPCKEERLTVEESFLLLEQEGKGVGGKNDNKKVFLFTVLGQSLNHRLEGLATEILHQFYVVRATK